MAMMASRDKRDSELPTARRSGHRESCSSHPSRRRTARQPGNLRRPINADNRPEPSYARPTISHQAKRITLCAASNHGGALESNLSRKGTTLAASTRKHQPQRNFKAAWQSTISSRRKALWPGSFRFLDLPADIRNIVYGYIELDQGSNAIKMISDPGLKPWKSPAPVLVIDLSSRNWQYRMPAILRLENAQLRSEFGSFYFTKRLIRIWVDMRREAQQMRRFLNFIGRANSRLLDENEDNVHVAFQRASELVQRRDWGLKECREPGVWSTRGHLEAIGYTWSESSGYVFDRPS